MSTMSPTEGALFELRAGATGQLDLTVLSIQGREAMSRLYRFDVTFAAELDPAALRRAVLGKPAELSLLSPGEGTYRRIRGITASLVDLGTRDDRGRSHHTLRLVPRAWLLRKRRTSRIFQDMTVVDVVNKVLDEHGVARRWKAVRSYPKRAYCVQYQETDLDFVARLLSEDGVFFYFEEHERAGGSERAPWEQRAEVMILGDGAGAYMPVPAADEESPASRPVAGPGGPVRSPPVVPYRAMAGGVGAEEHVAAFRRVSSVKTAAVRHHDYDFERPMLDLTVSTLLPVAGAAAGAAVTGSLLDPAELPEDPERLELYEHHGDHSNVEEALDRAEVRLQQLRRRATSAKGEGNCRRLAPGRTFRLEGHLEPQLDGDHVVSRVVHAGQTPGHVGQGSSAEHAYRCTFECAPASVPLRPAPPRRRLVRAVESAVVVGPGDQSIYADEYGRIKVQFHWDREGKRDERSSCWIRLAQPWAGAGYGFQFLPRVGTEVIVSFLGGDPDRPVVVGSLYNRIHMPPFPLPFAKTRSGIRTSSTGDGGQGSGGGNELSFEDAVGQEQIRVHARRDLVEEVERDHRRVVRGAEISEVAGGSSVTVAGGQRTSVSGASELVVAGDRSVDVRGDDLVTVEGDSVERRSGDAESTTTGDLRQTVGGSASYRLHGPVRVEAGDDLLVGVDGNHRLTVGVDGTQNVSDTFVFGDMTLSTTGSIQIRAEEEITLTCGGTSLRLTPEKLEVLGKALHLFGGEEALVAGGKAAAHLHDDAELWAETIHAFSKGGSLELTDSEARLGASKVKLGQPQSGKPKEADAPPDPEKKTVKWRFAGLGLKPYAGKKYHLLTCGLRFEGETDGDGVVTAEIPKEARSAEVILWVGEYPGGARRRYSIVIADEMPAASSETGARVRLHALGYDVGLHSPNPRAAMERAVYQFQADRHESDGLTVTGVLDDATKHAIEKVFGG